MSNAAPAQPPLRAEAPPVVTPPLPLAWLAEYRKGSIMHQYVTTNRELAVENDADGDPVPLFAAQAPASPSLSDEREALAHQILGGLCANPGGPFQSNPRSGWGLCNCTMDQLAETAYELADAMLARAILATRSKP